MIDILWQELTFGLPDARQLAHVTLRLIAAAVLGALVGLERQRAGKPAGLRTHILVCVGTTVFVLAGAGIGMSADALSRVIQGLATGIGFIGAGTILKLQRERAIQGLTTAAGIWMTAAIGVAIGVGSLGLAVLSAGFAWLVLGVAKRAEEALGRRAAEQPPAQT